MSVCLHEHALAAVARVDRHVDVMLFVCRVDAVLQAAEQMIAGPARDAVSDDTTRTRTRTRGTCEHTHGEQAHTCMCMYI